MLAERTLLDDVRDVVLTLTGLAAWAVGLYKYKKAREAESALQLELGVDARSAASGNVVRITIQIKNSGKAAAFVRAEQAGTAVCRIRKVISPSGSSEIPWDSKHTQDLIPAINYMADWLDYYPGEPMIFEPNVTEVFHAIFSTDYHGTLWIRAELIDREKYKYQGDCLFTL